MFAILSYTHTAENSVYQIWKNNISTSGPI
jgi:hypothetical protein